MAIEGFSFLDAMYQTITAVTTAGFGEINPLGSAGQVFTIIIIILGVIVILYVLTGVMQIAVEGELESILGARRMKTKIEALKDHYILCGFGRVGTEIAREFTARIKALGPSPIKTGKGSEPTEESAERKESQEARPEQEAAAKKPDPQAA